MTSGASATAAQGTAEPAARVRCHAVIVTYNSERHLPALLADLMPAVTAGDLALTVVDNGSRDGTRDLLAARPGIRVLSAPHNPGYAAAINIARAHTPPDTPLLVLNPDLRVGPGAIEALLQALADPEVGVAVPTVVDDAGQVYPSLRREPSLRRALGDALLGARLPQRPAAWGEMLWDVDAYPTITDVDWATGAALLVSPRCDAAVGAWDEERFFMYSEETDLCRRARAAGFRVRHVPAARVVHEGGGSGSSPDLVALMAVNRVRYAEKHHGRAVAGLTRAITLLHAALRPHQPGQRRALRMLLRRADWARLPGGRPGRVR